MTRTSPVAVRSSLAICRQRINYKNNCLLFLFPFAAVIKIFQFTVLPDKYFYDSGRILAMVLNPNTFLSWGGSYKVAADFFRAINLLHFDTLMEWSFFVAVVGNFILFFMLSRMNPPDGKQFFFLICSIALLNLYVFNISKDIIQFLFFFVLYLILLSPIQKSGVKVFLCVCTLLLASIFFKSYYMLIAGFGLLIYLIFRTMRKKHTLFEVLAVLLICIAAFLIIAQIVVPNMYLKLVNARSVNDNRVNDPDAVTIINNLIGGSGVGIYFLNLIINIFRIMFPVELLTKGIIYTPFIVYQIMVTTYIISLLLRLRNIQEKRQFIALCLFLGYTIASATFEPDFGSWVRHESSTFPLLILCILPYQKRTTLYQTNY